MKCIYNICALGKYVDKSKIKNLVFKLTKHRPQDAEEAYVNIPYLFTYEYS